MLIPFCSTKLLSDVSLVIENYKNHFNFKCEDMHKIYSKFVLYHFSGIVFLTFVRIWLLV